MLGRSASLLALGMGMALATPAFAQAAAADADEIVVTGLRASINLSVEEKKINTSMVEVISAEDIGKLPDQSIAESLSRLPGLATQRLDGRANVDVSRFLRATTVGWSWINIHQNC
jgi:iron complex outermembrane receptor protein